MKTPEKKLIGIANQSHRKFRGKLYKNLTNNTL